MVSHQLELSQGGVPMKAYHMLLMSALLRPVQYAPMTDPSPAAFETAVMREVQRSPYQHDGLIGDMVNIGEFYCTLKREGRMQWQSQMSDMRREWDQWFNDGKDTLTEYLGNMNDAIQFAEVAWQKYRFQSPAAYNAYIARFGQPTNEIQMYDAAMALADAHLCPGWPGHPMPQRLRDENKLD
jgi:hypothetical protein